MTDEKIDAVAAQMLDAYSRQSIGREMKWEAAGVGQRSLWRHVAGAAERVLAKSAKLGTSSQDAILQPSAFDGASCAEFAP